MGRTTGPPFTGTTRSAIRPTARTAAWGGVMIALNFLARFFSILLIFFVLATTFYFHDFWNQSPPDNAKTLIEALKNLSIIGALFMIAGYGRGPRNSEPAYDV